MPRGACVVKYHGKRGDVWRIKYTDASSKQVQETIGKASEGWTRKDADEALQDRLSDVRRKNLRKPAPITLNEFAPAWLAERTVKNELKQRSVSAYTNSLDRLRSTKLGPMPLGKIRPSHLADYIREALEAGYSARTVNYDVSMLHAIFKTAQGKELVESNPAAVVERAKTKKRNWRILTLVEISRVVREFKNERARLVFLTLISTGLRRHELRNLLWRDLDFIDATLRVVESKSEHGRRTIALPPVLKEALLDYRMTGAIFKGDGEYVFAHPRTGGKLNVDWFKDEFDAARKRAGIEGYVRPCHDLRHSMITLDAATNANTFAVKTKAGHKSLAMTQEYVHLAGQVFHDEADALEKRMLGGTKLYPSEPTSLDLVTPEAA